MIGIYCFVIAYLMGATGFQLFLVALVGILLTAYQGFYWLRKDEDHAWYNRRLLGVDEDSRPMYWTDGRF